MEINTLPSITMPNEAMSVRQIIERYAQGAPVSQSQSGFYDTEEDFSEFDSMDKFDKLQYIKDNEDYIRELQARVDATTSVAKDSPPQEPKPDSEPQVPE